MFDYRWYKDVFMSKVTLREDGFANYWKEKFISGLPKLFSEKVKTNLERYHGHPIRYETLTYGQLHNIVVQTGIQICTDFRLQNKMRKESMSNKRELGTFCHQYGVEPIRAPKKHFIMRKESTIKIKIIKSLPNKNIRKNKNTKSQRNKLNIGYYANKCRIIQKINQLEDESLKENLLNILKESDLEETSGEEESKEDLELEQIENNLISSELEEDNEYCLGVGLCSCNDCKILNDIITKDEKSRKEVSHICMKEIMNRFNDTNQIITIKYLQEEIRTLKQELEGRELINRQKGKEKLNEEEEKIENPFINILTLIITHK
ncbi:hypothetical protein CR513_06593, partial [Mucuna pruriens]